MHSEVRALILFWTSTASLKIFLPRLIIYIIEDDVDELTTAAHMQVYFGEKDKILT